MREIPISGSRGKCPSADLSNLEVNCSCPEPKRYILGDMLGTGKIVGDIIAPVLTTGVRSYARKSAVKKSRR
jgi:hypothetical protein